MTFSAEISPVTRSKAQAQANYDRMSRWYDWLAGRSERRFRDAGVALLAVQPGERVLEIGCGPGSGLAAMGDSAESLTGLDISRAMLQQAQRRVNRRTLLVQGDGGALPFADACFDALFVSFTLELFDTPELLTVLEACRRVLRPHGRLVVVSLQQARGLAVRLYEQAHRRWPVAVDCRPIPVEALLRAGNFRIAKVRHMTMWRLPVAIVLAHA
jgi:demethylmenaquinone methyltransferase/2-methoxy-6-polyprenyl-1,4-benzoquinol methylase